MKLKIKNVIDYIESNYHSYLDEEEIRNLTGVSLGHFRNEFTSMVGMPLDRYRIRRELALIMEEIEENGADIIKSNLLPWNSVNSFSKEFKKEYKTSPKRFLKQKNAKLQKRFDIDTIINEDIIAEKLKKKYRSYEDALIFLLRLPAIKMHFFSRLVVYKDINEIYKTIVCDYYNWVNDAHFCNENVPEEYYKKYLPILEKYYNPDQCLMFNYKRALFDEEGKTEDLDINFLQPTYIIVKRTLIRSLLSKIDVHKFFSVITVAELKTLWHWDIIHGKKKARKGEGVIPNEVTELKTSIGKWGLVLEMIHKENGFLSFNSFEELREHIKYDEDKPKEREYICDKCTYKEYRDSNGDCICSLDECCPRERILTQEEKEQFSEEDEYEELTIQSLYQKILELMYEGILYL